MFKVLTFYAKCLEIIYIVFCLNTNEIELNTLTIENWFEYPATNQHCFCLSVASGALAVVMGMRYKKSGKLLPAGIMSGLRSEFCLLYVQIRVVQREDCATLWFLIGLSSLFFLQFVNGVSTFAPDHGMSA